MKVFLKLQSFKPKVIEFRKRSFNSIFPETPGGIIHHVEGNPKVTPKIIPKIPIFERKV